MKRLLREAGTLEACVPRLETQMADERIIARIARKLSEGDAVEGLAQRLAPTDLQSLMLHVYRTRSAKR